VLDSLGNIGRCYVGVSNNGAGRICYRSPDIARGADTLRKNHAGKQHGRKKDSQQMDIPHKPSQVAVAKREEIVWHSRPMESGGKVSENVNECSFMK
jgi:hypothetical protein